MRDYLPLLEEELAYRGEDRRAPGWRLDDIAPGRRLRGADHRRGHVGPARRAPPAAGGRDVRRSSRRTTTSAARGSRTRIRGAGSTTPTTTTATRSRSGTTGRCTSRRKTCCSTTSNAAPTSSGCATTSASARRCSRRRGRKRMRSGQCSCVRPTVREETIVANAVVQRGRPAESAVVPRHPGPRHVRGTVVPLGRAGITRSTSRASASR